MKTPNFFQQFASSSGIRHPYYPENLRLDGYTPQIVEFDYILGVFFVSMASVALLTWLHSGRFKQLSTTERVVSCWFAVTGVIHFVIEGKKSEIRPLSTTVNTQTCGAGYVVVYSEYYKNTAGNYLSDACRFLLPCCFHVLLSSWSFR